MGLDSRYYETMFEGIYPRLKNINETDLNNSLKMIIKKLEEIFKNIEMDYKLRGRYVIFSINKINRYIFEFEISFDLVGINLDENKLKDFEEYLVQRLKYCILERWDNFILKER